MSITDPGELALVGARFGALLYDLTDAVRKGRMDNPVESDSGYGLLAAFDLAPKGAPGARGYACLKRLYQEGLLLKWTAIRAFLHRP